jgi:hypothetical protein
VTAVLRHPDVLDTDARPGVDRPASRRRSSHIEGAGKRLRFRFANVQETSNTRSFS